MLCNFLSNILKKSKDSITPEKTQRLINSLSAGISGVTNAKFLTAKHFLLLVRLNTLTGSRYVINILNKLGHCMPHKLACEIEASQVVPNSESSSILTVFWVDNSDTVVEQVQGGGSVNTTYMMAFQEMIPETKMNDITRYKFKELERESLWAVNLNQLMQISIKEKSSISAIKWGRF